MQVLIDSGKKHFVPLFFTGLCGLSVTVFATFVRPQIVMASDLTKVVESVDRIEDRLDKTNALVEAVAKAQLASQRYYLEDQIRILEVTQVERKLSPTETQRLYYYRNALNNLYTPIGTDK